MNTIEQKNYTQQKHSFLHKKKKIIINGNDYLILFRERWIVFCTDW